MGFAKAHDRLHALCSALQRSAALCRTLCRTLCTCPARALHASLRALHPFLHPTPGSGRADACAMRHGQGQLPQAGHRRVGLPGGGGQRRCTATAERELLCEYSAPDVASAPSAPCLCTHCSPLQPLRALQHSPPSAPSTPPPQGPPVPSCALRSLCILCALPLVPFAGGRRSWPAEGPLRLRPGVLAGHMPLAPTWLGLGPTRRGSNPTQPLPGCRPRLSHGDRVFQGVAFGRRMLICDSARYCSVAGRTAGVRVVGPGAGCTCAVGSIHTSG